MTDFFILKNWKLFSRSCWFWGYQNFGPVPWEFDFENFTQILKLRGLRPYAWVIYSQNHPMCISYYAGHFYIRNWGYLFDFTITYAILTPVISNFWSVFHAKPYLPHFPPGRHWYQKMQNFSAHLLIYVKSLSHNVPLLKHPRKSLKVDFHSSVPRK